jgi:membrane protease YdiL (CAAX protease family)
VAVAEEAFLRGALWDAAAGMRGGERTALVVTTVVFAVIHLPFYGPASLPLNLAVGLLLGGVRQWTGGWAAPAVAHTLADICGWWLR